MDISAAITVGSYASGITEITDNVALLSDTLVPTVSCSFGMCSDVYTRKLGPVELLITTLLSSITSSMEPISRGGSFSLLSSFFRFSNSSSNLLFSSSAYLFSSSESLSCLRTSSTSLYPSTSSSVFVDVHLRT